MSDAAKLEALGAVVGEADGAAEAAQAEQAAEAQAAQDAEAKAREWGMILFTLGQAGAMFAPELAKVYGERACLAWGHSVVPVAEKYGWGDVGNVPEIALALSSLGFVVPTVLIVKARLAELAAERAKAKADPGTVSDATYTGGAGVPDGG